MKTDAGELLINHRSVPVIEGIAVDRGPLRLHRRLPGYARTPLLEIPSLAERLGVGRLWVKDESSRLGLQSFKILGASYAVYRALCERLGAEPSWSDIDELRRQVSTLAPMTLAAATDGNHGLAVARMARLLGLTARVYVPATMIAARIEAIESEDAAVTVVDGDYDDAVRRSAEDASDGCIVVSDTSWPGYQRIPWWVIEGYSTIFWEVDDALHERGAGPPDVVVVPMGVGALAAATVRHYRRPEASAKPRLVGVEPLSADCVLASLRAGRPVTIPGPHDSIMAGLNCGTPSQLAWPLLRDGMDVVAAIDDTRACAAVRQLAGVGIVAGETGAAGIGALAELRDEAGQARVASGLSPVASVLVVVTEGATDPQSYARITTGHA
ncbi:diaminopropionate ammonia-lyase [Saccharopolyspora elongata]|uniref:Diaminopropionate ammonia-lyase n=1 Tax=Saccharopolyspora elongata TaxID=2530387 RepID=A0A4R4YUX5_9PSEU|nr:diaminopropionate ammonia-lyase [Saccharopolyspora elongata]TDD48109.1 diaminopropionate ammonia-lyase [Saccharopolyspora elongata]